jgi:hypothetical protein
VANAAAVPFRPVDFNNDGRRDVIFVSNTEYEIHFRNLDGTVTRELHPRRLSSGLNSYLSFEDFTADGKADLFDGYPDTKIFNAFHEEVLVIQKNVCDLITAVPRSLNFDGDPLSEIVSWNGDTGLWKRGNAAFSPTGNTTITSFAWGSASLGDIPAPGDFDGDGKTDHTVYRDGEGNWYTLLSSTGAWSVVRFGLPGDIPVPNDYNGGGKSDYAVFRPSTGNWYIWYAETQEFSIVHWGANGDRPVPADFDGDAKFDIAVFRPAEGNWYYIRSSDSGFGIFHWGSVGDIPLPADYEGDGKADLTVYRAGVWYILRTTNDETALVFWGTTGDIPIPVMQRGNISHPVVYRSSNSRWFNSQYPIGSALIMGGGTPVYFGLPNN